MNKLLLLLTSDKELKDLIQGHFEGCCYAILSGHSNNAASYARTLHRLWQEVERRKLRGKV